MLEPKILAEPLAWPLWHATAMHLPRDSCGLGKRERGNQRKGEKDPCNLIHIDWKDVQHQKIASDKAWQIGR